MNVFNTRLEQFIALLVVHSTPKAFASSSVLYFSTSLASSWASRRWECPGTTVRLRQFRQRFDAWDDWYSDAHFTGFSHEIKIFLIIIKQLCNGILRAQILFLFQIHQIHFHIGSFFVLFRIGCHTVVECFAGMFDRVPSAKNPSLKRFTCLINSVVWACPFLIGVNTLSSFALSPRRSNKLDIPKNCGSSNSYRCPRWSLRYR